MPFLKSCKKTTKILLTKIPIRLHLEMCNPKASLMQTLSAPPFISSFLSLPSGHLSFSSTMPFPPGYLLALRWCLTLMLYSTIQDKSGSFPILLLNTTPCVFRTRILLRHHFSVRIYTRLLLAFCYKHSYFLLRGFVFYLQGKLVQHLIFYNHTSLNPYNSRLWRFTYNIQRSPRMLFWKSLISFLLTFNT